MPRTLDSGSARSFLELYDTFLIDCDGVLWNGSVVLPAAVPAVAMLQRLGKRVFFITNNSTKSRVEYAAKMKQLQFSAVSPDIIFCSSSLAALYLSRHHPDVKKVYVVGERGIGEELASVGVASIGGEKEQIQTNYIMEDDMKHLPLDPDVGAVICGWDRRFSFRKLCIASAYLHNSHQRQGGCVFIATNRDSADKVTDLRFIPGGGCMVAAIEASSVVPGKIQARCTGKPDPWCVELLEELHSIQRHRTIVIGDRLDTDILLGQHASISSLFVLSGANSLADLDSPYLRGARGKIVPDYIASDIGIFLSMIDTPTHTLPSPKIRSAL